MSAGDRKIDNMLVFVGFCIGLAILCIDTNACDAYFRAHIDIVMYLSAGWNAATLAIVFIRNMRSRIDKATCVIVAVLGVMQLLAHIVFHAFGWHKGVGWDWIGFASVIYIFTVLMPFTVIFECLSLILFLVDRKRSR